MASIKRRRGSSIWTCWYRDERGKQHCRSTETTDRKLAVKVAEAFEAAAQKKRTLRQFSKIMAEMHQMISGDAVSNLSLRSFAAEWLDGKKLSCAPRTVTFYSDSASKLISFLGVKAEGPISEITKRELVAYRAELVNTLAPNSVNHHLAAVKTLFKSALRDSVIHEDPAQFVQTVRRVHGASGRRGFTLPEINAVLSVADAQWKSMIFFGLYTGQRLGDIARLCWNNVDLEHSQLRFVTAKTGRTMILPLAPPLAKHLLELAGSDNPDGPLHPRAHAILAAQGRSGSLSNQFAELLSQAGLREKTTRQKAREGRSARRQSTGLSFHSLRHSVTSFLHAAGIPSATTKAFVGHSSALIHDLYIHTDIESLTRAAQALPEVL